MTVAVAQQVTVTGTLPALPELPCGGTLQVHYGHHTHLSPQCCIAEAPECQDAPPSYVAPVTHQPAPVEPSYRRSRRDDMLAVGVAVCALSALTLLVLASLRWM